MTKPRVYKEPADSYHAQRGKPWVCDGNDVVNMVGAVHWPTWELAMWDAARLCQWQADELL